MTSASKWLVILAVLTTTCLSSCGDRRRPSPPPSPEPYTDVVGPLGVNYFNLDESVAAVTTARRTEILGKLRVSLDNFEARLSWAVKPVKVRVYPYEVRRVPNSGLNGVGLYVPGENTIYLNGTIEAAFHELNHHRLFWQGDPAWYLHSGSEWEQVWLWKLP